MPEKCPACGQDFAKEPGFYSGALWVSYPIVMLLLISGSATAFFLFKFSFAHTMLIAVTVLIGLQPLIMRYSRAIWINLFVSYQCSN